MLKSSKILERGFTLIELMVVIAIIGIATVVVLQDAAVTHDAERAKFQMEEVQSIVRAANLAKDATTVGLSNYQNLTSAYLASHKMIPDRYLNAAGTGIDHAYNGIVNVTKWLNNGYLISLMGMTQKGCMDLVANIETDTVAVLDTIDGGTVRNVITPAVRDKNLAVACSGAGANDVMLYINN